MSDEKTRLFILALAERLYLASEVLSIRAERKDKVNHTKAKCGHYMPAVGAPGSEARAKYEASLCVECQARHDVRPRDCEECGGESSVDRSWCKGVWLAVCDECEEVVGTWADVKARQ